MDKTLSVRLRGRGNVRSLNPTGSAGARNTLPFALAKGVFDSPEEAKVEKHLIR